MKKDKVADKGAARGPALKTPKKLPPRAGTPKPVPALNAGQRGTLRRLCYALEGAAVEHATTASEKFRERLLARRQAVAAWVAAQIGEGK